MSKRIRETISAKELEKARACKSELEKFEKVFGTGRVVINKANLYLAYKEGFSIGWFIRMFLEDTSIKVDYNRNLQRNYTTPAKDGYDALLKYLNEQENK